MEKIKIYQGEPLEKGGTSIKAGASPAVKWLVKKGHIRAGDQVLDYGAGKYARNARWLIEKGCRVVAYDPYNYTECACGVSVLPELPEKAKFDVGLSVYVLNVVPEYIEKRIVADMQRRCKINFHIVRGYEMVESIASAVYNKREPVYSFFTDEYGDRISVGRLDRSGWDFERIEEFCKFGVKTRRGFQRIANGTKTLLKETKAYKIYIG